MSKATALLRMSLLRAGMLALLAGTALTGIATAGDEVYVDGTLHVRNGATPTNGTETIQLRELWRAGGEDDEIFFGVVTQIQVDDEGNIYLLDTQLSEVQVYSPDGEHLRTLSRQGDGPGESNRPSDMLFMPDGSIGLVQTFPGKIVKIDLEGDPAGTFTTGGDGPTQGGFAVMIDVQQGGGNLLVGGIDISVDQAAGIQTRTNFLASFADDGAEKARYEEKVDTWDFSNLTLSEKTQYFVHFRRWTVGRDGRVYTAPHRNRYAINVYNSDGTLDRVIEREFTSWKRNEKYMNRVNALMEAQAKRLPFEFKIEIEDTEPDVTALHIAADGSLWVYSSRSAQEQPEGIMETYDVFDAKGHFDRQVAVACDGDGEEDALFFVGSDRVIRVTAFWDAIVALQGATGTDDGDGEEPEPMEVICYAVETATLTER